MTFVFDKFKQDYQQSEIFCKFPIETYQTNLFLGKRDPNLFHMLLTGCGGRIRF